MAAAQPQPTPQPGGSVPSLTFKQQTAKLDEVDYELQSIQKNIEQFRLDFRSGLGRTAAIRVLDMGVALVRDRASLNYMPRLIGAMDREGRPDWLQRDRKDQLMKRLGTLIGTHGQLNRAIEGYAADLKEKFGIDIQRFLDAIATQVEQGKNVDALIGRATRALRENNNDDFMQATQQAESGDLSAPPPPPPLPPQGGPQGQDARPPMTQPAAQTADDIQSIMVDPNDPTKLIVTMSDGRTYTVPFTRGPNGELMFNLPGIGAVTIPVQKNASGEITGKLPGGGQLSLPPELDPAKSGRPKPGTPPPLPSGVSPTGDGRLAVTMPDGSVRYFPADLTKPGIGTRYLGEKGTQLREETEEFLDLSDGGQYKIRQGRSITWQFAVMPVGQQPEAGGTRASFRLADRAGQGRFTVSNWRIVGPDGTQVATGSGEAASALVTQSGTYKIEFSGATEWGSPFRIEGQVTIAVQ